MIPTEHPTLAQLWSAAHVCPDCGTAWGTPTPHARTSWEATCHLCGAMGLVTHVRHYGYLRRGLALVERRETRPTTTETP